MKLDEMLERRDELRKEISELNKQILPYLDLWQSKALHGFKVEAVLQLRENTGGTLRECMDKVNDFIHTKTFS